MISMFGCAERESKMNHRNFEVAQTMATKLFAAEEAIDAALNKAADLAGFMPMARQEAKLSAEVGQDAFEHLLESMKMLTEARKHMIDTHGALARTQSSARLAPRNFGGFINKPRYASSKLTIVGEDRQAA